MENSDFIFSYAENAEGRIVHVDDVPNGKECGCRCPYCKEPLVARQGEKNTHGFAHHSESRKSNLKICYAVTLYKLAEQFLLDKKAIHAPSYYGIYPETLLEFKDVKIDSRYERSDRQPDVIATTTNGDVFVIEFIFHNTVFHKQPINYNNTNCIEIDLSGQTLETIKDFLQSKPTSAWRWTNNNLYFNQIVETYKNHGKDVRIVDTKHCETCEVMEQIGCAGICSRHTGEIVTIKNNGIEYRVCKSEIYNKCKADLSKKREEAARQKIEEQRRKELEIKRREEAENERLRMQESMQSSERSCFDCERNLWYANNEGYANCGFWKRLGLKKKNSPTVAQTCKSFKLKQKK